MIHYHGLPITPASACVAAVTAGHAFVSFAHADQLPIAVAVCQSFALDNGAFSAWRSGQPIADWAGYYAWAAAGKMIPACDFAVIPDVIDGDEAANDALLAEWPLPRWFGAPVWHMRESLGRFARLVDEWPRVCIGSSGQYATIGTAAWWAQMAKAMRVVCNDDGRPRAKLHGLRMLDPEIFTRLPFASADSTNIGRNVGIDQKWKGNYMPPNKDVRAAVMRSRIEANNAPEQWAFNVPELTQGSFLCE